MNRRRRRCCCRRKSIRKGIGTMKVRAKWNVRDAAGWHVAGAVFETDEDLGDAVEVLEGPKRRAVKKPEQETAPAPETEPAPETVTEAIPEGGEVPDSDKEPEAETPKAPEKAQGRPRNSRRKNYSK